MIQPYGKTFFFKEGNISVLSAGGLKHPGAVPRPNYSLVVYELFEGMRSRLFDIFKCLLSLHKRVIGVAGALEGCCEDCCNSNVRSK